MNDGESRRATHQARGDSARPPMPHPPASRPAAQPGRPSGQSRWQPPPQHGSGPTAPQPLHGFPPPAEGTQVLRRDGRPEPELAWSQAPARPLPPRQPPPVRHAAAAPRPVDTVKRPPGGIQYAPTQQPQRFTERQAPPPPSLPPRRTPAPPPSASLPRRRRHWGRRILISLLLMVLIPLLFMGGLVWYADGQLNRFAALPSYPGRPAATAGTNWLLVGSDSRAGLTPADEKKLATGGDTGAGRTDTIIVVHTGSGPTTMVSIPRDSYVDIPGNGKDKINAAFAIGGAPLLVRTVEGATGLRIDHYAEIGFGGFAGVIDAMGGIDMCLKTAMKDPEAGINLPSGCQKLGGADALGYVRSRKTAATPAGDLDRARHQREMMAAVLQKATSAGTLANPFALWPLVSDFARSLRVDEGDHLWHLASLGWALRGELVTTAVPIANPDGRSDVGSVVLWDQARAGRFFGALANDTPIPPDLLTKG